VPPSWPEIKHHVGLGLGDPGGDRADADLGDQLDVHPADGLAHFRSWISCLRSSIE
jgi:hypothetical protein